LPAILARLLAFSGFGDPMELEMELDAEWQCMRWGHDDRPIRIVSEGRFDGFE
jgi:hypothetical protein